MLSMMANRCALNVFAVPGHAALIVSCGSDPPTPRDFPSITTSLWARMRNFTPTETDLSWMISMDVTPSTLLTVGIVLMSFSSKAMGGSCYGALSTPFASATTVRDPAPARFAIVTAPASDIRNRSIPAVDAAIVSSAGNQRPVFRLPVRAMEGVATAPAAKDATPVTATVEAKVDAPPDRIVTEATPFVIKTNGDETPVPSHI